MIYLCSTAASRPHSDPASGTWVHAFFVSLASVAMLSIPVGVILIVAGRDRGDGMPAALWAPEARRTSAASQIYRVSWGYRLAVLALWVCTFGAARSS